MMKEENTAVICDDCGNFIGEGSAHQYEECELCGSTHLVEETLFVCSCGFNSLEYFEYCPECQED